MTREVISNLKEFFKEVFPRESKEFLKLAFPLILTYILTMFIQLETLFFIGNLGSEILAAAGLGYLWANVTANSILFGLASALETLSSQANGAKNYPRLGILLQRSFYISIVVIIPISILWWFSPQVFLILRQEPGISQISGEYMRVLILSLIPSSAFESLKRYLQTQAYVYPAIWATLFGVCINGIFQFVFISVFDWKLTGAAIGTTLTYIGVSLFLIIYIKVKKIYVNTWHGFSKEAFKDWKEYLLLGFPGALMLFLEWGSFESVALILGLLQENETFAAHVIITNTVQFCFMMPLGFAIAATTRIGNLLGAGKYKVAQHSVYTLVLLIFGIYLFNSNVTFFFRYYIAHIYSEDPVVIEKFAQTMPFVSYLFLLVDPFQGSLSGVLRGVGKQGVGALINLIAFYFIGIPAAFLAILYFKFGLIGAWIGLLLGEGTIMIGYLTVICLINWEKVSEKAIIAATKGHSMSSSNLLEGIKSNEDIFELQHSFSNFETERQEI